MAHRFVSRAAAAALLAMGAAACTDALPEPTPRHTTTLPDHLAVDLLPSDDVDLSDDAMALTDVVTEDLLDDDALDTGDDSTDSTDSTDATDASDATDSSDADLPPPPPPISCLALRDRDPGLPSAIYEIDPDGPEGLPARRVFCDMTTADGGWTLVARADDGPTGEFGWPVSYGEPDDFDRPYSFGVIGSGLEFTEILVGSRMLENTWANVYLLTAPADFLTACAETDCLVPGGPRVVAGECLGANPDEPRMLLRVGYTSRRDHFYLRDIAGYGRFGLFPWGFDAAEYEDCELGGYLHERRGLIMVR